MPPDLYKYINCYYCSGNAVYWLRWSVGTGLGMWRLSKSI